MYVAVSRRDSERLDLPISQHNARHTARTLRMLSPWGVDSTDDRGAYWITVLSREACVQGQSGSPNSLPQDRMRQSCAVPTWDDLQSTYWRAGFGSKPGSRSSTGGSVQVGRTASAKASCDWCWAHSYKETGLVQRALDLSGVPAAPDSYWFTRLEAAPVAKMRVPYTPERKALIPTREIWKV